MSVHGSRLAIVVASIILVALGTFQYCADILSTLSCGTSTAIQSEEKSFIATTTTTATVTDTDTVRPLFLPKEANVSLAESFRDNKTVVYLLHQRKAGGTSLRQFLLDEYSAVVGAQRALATSYVPCLIQACENWDPDPRRQFIGQKRLLAGHLSYTIAAARAVYGEKQVLISNFRDPIARIEACIKFRFPQEVAEKFDQSDFNVRQMTYYFLSKQDIDGDTCLGEPFRMLSPYNPNKVISDDGIQQVCNFAKTYVHMVNFGLRLTSLTTIEDELFVAGSKYKLQQAKLTNKTDTFVANMEAFKDYIRRFPEVKSEQKLYDCVSRV